MYFCYSQKINCNLVLPPQILWGFCSALRNLAKKQGNASARRHKKAFFLPKGQESKY
jgi:hypothetical protein